MKKIGLLICTTLVVFSCKEDKKDAVKNNDINDTISSIHIEPTQEDIGLWSGIFEADSVDYDKGDNWSLRNRISIVIQKINNNNTVEGYSVSAGNIRPFKGDLVKEGNSRYVMANEPGDQKYDGTFKFNISEKDDSIYGIWISKRKDLPVLSRKFSLKKTTFNYDPKNILIQPKYGVDEEYADEYDNVDWVNSKKKKYEESDGEEYFVDVQRAASDEIYKINGSTQKLTEKQLKNLHKLDLEIIRNTIYARHGYSFANRGARQFFDYVDWYVPLYTNVEDKLSSIEKDNIALLKRFEKYATDNYQQYGR
ncbi:YARHG domain-containing protein [Empedobacter falsenii]|uniref:YARHG domain-containing protein n=1 Tax=Empedobacter falsenii TaxID=343874 RepID=A0A427BTD7_9FLAO|nr:YARHG domain-containing protein [Empedobacter falsenii]RRT94587.1 YARHG domain-containing protein [Empedobacter falsenii]RRT94833.1 YARHG domain-containing protein [Empedobacter falsenii]